MIDVTVMCYDRLLGTVKIETQVRHHFYVFQIQLYRLRACSRKISNKKEILRYITAVLCVKSIDRSYYINQNDNVQGQNYYSHSENNISRQAYEVYTHLLSANAFILL